MKCFVAQLQLYTAHETDLHLDIRVGEKIVLPLDCIRMLVHFRYYSLQLSI